MTNKEAIGHLQTIIIYSENDGYTDKAREALKMAIEALQHQERTCGKCACYDRQFSYCNKLGVTFSDDDFCSYFEQKEEQNNDKRGSSGNP